ncbi:hypothetical protein GCM10027199_48030 [Amycolatopsis magusensis]
MQYDWETGRAKLEATVSEGLVALEAGARLGSHRVDSDLLFTESDGTPLHPADVTARFAELAKRAGLSPIRLHDLGRGRHPRSGDRHGMTDRAGHAPAFFDHRDHGHLHHRVEMAHAAAEALAGSSRGWRRDSSCSPRARKRA